MKFTDREHNQIECDEEREDKKHEVIDKIVISAVNKIFGTLNS